MPDSLAALAFRHAIEVDEGLDFDHHVDRLIKGIERLRQESGARPREESRKPGEATVGASPQRSRGKWLVTSLAGAALAVSGILFYPGIRGCGSGLLTDSRWRR